MKKILILLILFSLTACTTLQQETVVSSTPATTYIAKAVYPNTTVHELSNQPFEDIHRSERDLIRRATVFLGHGYEPYLQDISAENTYLLKNYEPTVTEQKIVGLKNSRYNWLNPLTVQRLGEELDAPQQVQNELIQLHNDFVNQTETCTGPVISISNTLSHLTSEHNLGLVSLYGDQEQVSSPNDLTTFIDQVQNTSSTTIIHIQGFPERTTQQISTQANLDILRVDPTISTDYIDRLETIQQTVVSSLNC